ncbi:hypothetical protein P4562_21730 [Lysinibacillus xylanilyticus]|uniref:hypothetical protein n=1 Tax=Lysinibacillus xylanilyticus TaxID=582475 RepID=UPI002E1DCCAD|nr:hypothetical protein [Lysinibacillus xylanilyticus]
MVEFIDFVLATSFLLNPVFAIVFCLNLTGFIKKTVNNSEASTRSNIFWMCIAATFIIMTLTWMFSMTG